MAIYHMGSFHHVKRVSAHTHGHGVLSLTFHGEPRAAELNEAEIKVFLDDQDLVDGLIKAINGVTETADA